MPPRLLLAFCLGLVPAALVAFQRGQTPQRDQAQRDAGRVVPAGKPIHVVAFGDYGSGNSHQAAVAGAIAQRNKSLPFDLGITLGDNFYFCGVRSVEDPKWRTRWEDFYTSLGFPFYAALGNHDYGHPPIICPLERGSPDAEVAYTARSRSWRMPARYYSFKAGPVLFVAIDTEGWSAEQLEWIRQTLAASADDPDIKWRVVYGHHPIYTSGVHLNQRRIGQLREQLLPVLKAAHVDAYICGHDHDLEHLRSDGIEFLICGGGGAKLRGFVGRREPNSVSSASKYAFLDLMIDAHTFSAQFLDTNLRSLEQPPLKDTK
jgi:tartrate-resistant acid phosphatase type 5